MNVLITGGCGFIGSNLIKLLLKKKEILKIVNLDKETYAANKEYLKDVNDSRYFFEKVDLVDKTRVFDVLYKHNITHVFHLAAETHVDNSISSPNDFIHTNIVGSYNLIEACRQLWKNNFKNKKFVHVSTDEVYGSLGANGTFTEESSYQPNSPYSASKASSDFLVRSYFKTFNFPAVITNCSNNFGPNQNEEKFVPVVINSILNDSAVPVYGNGLNVRDWIYVEDHCDALWLVMKKSKIGEKYNIGGDNEKTNLEIINAVCKVLDKNPKSYISYVKDRPGHDFRYAIDDSKIKKELKWKPKTDFKKGLAKTIEYYARNINN